MASADAVMLANPMAAFLIGAPSGTVRSCTRRSRSGALPGTGERLEDPLGRIRLLGELHTEGCERIVDGVSYRSSGAYGAGLADSLRTEERARDRALDMRDLDIGHFAGHGDEVVGHRAVQELRLIVIERLLEERCTDALHDAAAKLLVGEQRVHDASAILDDPVLQELHQAGARVDLEE